MPLKATDVVTVKLKRTDANGVEKEAEHSILASDLAMRGGASALIGILGKVIEKLELP